MERAGSRAFAAKGPFLCRILKVAEKFRRMIGNDS
jgi:hypothetical protein